MKIASSVRLRTRHVRGYESAHSRMPRLGATVDLGIWLIFERYQAVLAVISDGLSISKVASKVGCRVIPCLTSKMKTRSYYVQDQ
jgi:hypothetical protein